MLYFKYSRIKKKFSVIKLLEDKIKLKYYLYMISMIIRLKIF